MHHQSGTCLGAVEQVGGGVVGEGFALAVQAIIWAAKIGGSENKSVPFTSPQC